MTKYLKRYQPAGVTTGKKVFEEGNKKQAEQKLKHINKKIAYYSAVQFANMTNEEYDELMNALFKEKRELLVRLGR